MNQLCHNSRERTTPKKTPKGTPSWVRNGIRVTPAKPARSPTKRIRRKPKTRRGIRAQDILIVLLVLNLLVMIGRFDEAIILALTKMIEIYHHLKH